MGPKLNGLKILKVKSKMGKESEVAAIILAAGKGVRMRSKKVNKVMLPLVGRPMIAYTAELLRKLKIQTVAVVVGFAKDSVKNFLGPGYLYVEQKKRLGTAHATGCALEKIPPRFREILVLNGDDSAFYTEEVLNKLMKKHRQKNPALTLLTIETESPQDLGRVLRGKNGEIVGIVEEKDAIDSERKINEINPACYLFERRFLEKYLPRVKKSSASGEYYLTDLVKIGVESGQRVESLKVKNILWRGVNTPEELKIAEKMMKGFKNEN